MRNNKQNQNKLIPCIILVYSDFYIIKKSIYSIIQNSSNLKFIILENRSENTESLIKPFFLSLLRKGKIAKYILFEKNITNNVWEIFFKTTILPLEKFQYIILSDGDIYVDNPKWISEILKILNNNKDVFACGMNLSLDNLPLKAYPESINWYPPPKNNYIDYEEGLTGGYLLTLRLKDFKKFLEFLIKERLKFIDVMLHFYCYSIINKKWARTKENQAIHLTWDKLNVATRENDQIINNKKDFRIWNHNKYSKFRVYSRKGNLIYYLSYNLSLFYLFKLIRIIIYIFHHQTSINRILSKYPLILKFFNKYRKFLEKKSIFKL
ncbi:MAG: hypothetical protein ACTSVV_12715 [Promethearchaeota archaeon]